MLKNQKGFALIGLALIIFLTGVSVHVVNDQYDKTFGKKSAPVGCHDNATKRQ